MAFAFEALVVYQRSIALADGVCTISRALPRGFAFLGDQLGRASLSVAANIAEGNGRLTRPARNHFFGIARGSLLECVALLELASRQRLIALRTHTQLKGDTEQIARMLAGLINSSKRRTP